MYAFSRCISNGIKKHKRRILVLLLCFAASLALCEEDPYTFRVFVDRSEVRTGEEIQLRIQGRLPFALPFEYQGLEGADPELNVSFVEESTQTITPNLFLVEYRYRLLCDSPGAFEIPPIQFFFGGLQMATSTMVYIDVYDPEETFGLEETMYSPLQPRSGAWDWALWILTASFASGGIYGVWRYRLSLRIELPPIPKPPAQRVGEILNAFAAMPDRFRNADTPQKIRLLYYSMSMLLREYIDHIYSIDLLESTPREADLLFLESHEFPGEYEKKVVEFLFRCDLAKYSLLVPSEHSMKKDFETFQILFRQALRDKMGRV
ncbi:MAG TPA: BatD family protein [Thermotogota bacterium]|nr:BatD family protein [Thermotogota bacterium]